MSLIEARQASSTAGSPAERPNYSLKLAAARLVGKLTRRGQSAAGTPKPAAPAARPGLASDGNPMFLWHRGIDVEMDVQHAIRDLVRFGDVAFDVGVHRAGLSTVMSRCVGPRGVVCAFEASPRNVPLIMETITANGCGNVMLFHAAVGERSGDRVPFYYGQMSHSDTMHPARKGRKPNVQVETVALDDVVEETGLEPAFVKMDIEGNELAAVRGFRRTIERTRPTMVLEVGPSNAGVITLLTQELGYRTLDLQTYRPAPPEAEVRSMLDVLFTHPDRIPAGSSPYAEPPPIERLMTLDASAFEGMPSDTKLRKPLRLDAGRYIVRCDFDPGEGGGMLHISAVADGRRLALYISPAQQLHRTQREIVIDLPQAAGVDFRYQFPGDANSPGSGYTFRGLEVMRVEGFPHRTARVWHR